jgi:hypothetical protein
MYNIPIYNYKKKKNLPIITTNQAISIHLAIINATQHSNKINNLINLIKIITYKILTTINTPDTLHKINNNTNYQHINPSIFKCL